MKRYIPIRKICAREVLDSRGNPTVETEVIVGTHVLGNEGAAGKAIVPSGASTGMQEARELRDQDERYGGLGVQKAVGHVNVELADAILGEDALNQSFVDSLLLQTDGTENKEQLGANAVLSVSLAVADAAAKALRIPLFQYLGGCNARRMPVPMMNILNGGKHADNTIDFQEFMIMPIGASCFREGVRMCAEIYHKLKEQLRKRGLSTAVGDEGGFAPDIQSTRDAFVLMEEAVELAGYRPGKDIGFAMDAAASELYEKGKRLYLFRGESSMTGKTVVRTSKEMIAYYETLVEEFPLLSIEDGLSEEDWEGWSMLTARLGKRIQLVGDDLFVTNKKILKEGILEGIGNAVLVKVNQIGTLSEAMETVSCAQKAGYAAVVSHRSGESEDTFLADLAVALQTGQIKTGAPCRGERTAKYNRLLEIEELLGESALYENPFQTK